MLTGTLDHSAVNRAVLVLRRAEVTQPSIAMSHACDVGAAVARLRMRR
jgi:hypothetical protein